MLHLAQQAGKAAVALELSHDVLARVVGHLLRLRRLGKGLFRRADELHLVERLLCRADALFVPTKNFGELFRLRCTV